MEVVSNFMLEKKIDSFQKLRLLLFLYHHPDMVGTSEQFGRQLFISDSRLMDDLIYGLRTAGLIDNVGKRYVLHDDPAVQMTLRRLDHFFDDPVTRQQLLDRVRRPSVARPLAGQ